MSEEVLQTELVRITHSEFSRMSVDTVAYEMLKFHGFKMYELGVDMAVDLAKANFRGTYYLIGDYWYLNPADFDMTRMMTDFSYSRVQVRIDDMKKAKELA